MTKLICPKCKTESDSKFCPNCGRRMFQHVRSQEEIEAMIGHLKTASEIIMAESKGTPSSLFDLMNFMLINITLNWCKGGEITPLEVAVKNKGQGNEKLKTLIEVAKMGVARKAEK